MTRKKNQISCKPKCAVCDRTIAKNHRVIYSDLCQCRYHLKCVGMTLKGRGLTQREWLCTKCYFNVLPDSRALLYDSDTVDMSISFDHADSSQVVNSVSGFKFFQLNALVLKGLF